MKDKKESLPKKLGLYATILLLLVIIVIIFAAMADNREQNYENQINETTKINVSIQEEIVTLKDENYRLKQENEKLKASALTDEEKEAEAKIDNVYSLLSEGKTEDAKKAFAEISPESIPDKAKKYYNAVALLIKSDK